MEKEGMDRKIASGLLWMYMERLLAQGVSAVVTVILARVLLPEEYGVVSLVTVFITICDTLAVGGFSDALIQKKNADELDFSTLFWFVLALGLVLYGVVYALAPLAEVWLHTDAVCSLMRVMAIRLPINAIKTINSAYISKRMEHRYFFFATLFGTAVSAAVGIAMAYTGAGVWALAAQYLVNTIVDTAVIWFTCGWRPCFHFSTVRLKALYAFGWKMQLSSLLSALTGELESLCIGRKYSAADLAFYDKGRQFPRLIMHNIQSSITAVMLPTFSRVNDQRDRMKRMAKKSIKVSTFLMVPLLFGMIAVANEFVSVVLTDKWLPSVPFLQLLSVYYLLEPFMALNKQIVIALGEGKLYLRMEIAKKTIGIALLAAALLFTDSVLAVAASVVITQAIGLMIQSAPLKHLIGYSLPEQARDAAPAFINSLVMALAVTALRLTSIDGLPLLILEIVTGMTLYILSAIICKNEAFCYLLEKAKEIVGKKR